MPSLLQELVANSEPDNEPCYYSGAPIGYTSLITKHTTLIGVVMVFENREVTRPVLYEECQNEHCWMCWTPDLPGSQTNEAQPPTPRPHFAVPGVIATPIAPVASGSSEVYTQRVQSILPIAPSSSHNSTKPKTSNAPVSNSASDNHQPVPGQCTHDASGACLPLARSK